MSRVWWDRAWCIPGMLESSSGERLARWDGALEESGQEGGTPAGL